MEVKPEPINVKSKIVEGNTTNQKCPYCSSNVSKNGISKEKHIEYCRPYSEFILKNSESHKCLFCTKTSKR